LFYTKHNTIGRFRMGGSLFSSRQPDLSPDQGCCDSSHGGAPCPRHRSFTQIL